MHKLRRIGAGLLAGICLLAFSGCSKKKEETKKNTTKDETVASDSQETQNAVVSEVWERMGTDGSAETVESGTSQSIDWGSVKVGDTIPFGKYEWIILEKTDSSVFVISKDIVEFLSYSPKGASFPEQDPEFPVTWEESAVRNFLNEDFFYSCFSEQEQGMIMETKVVTAANPKFGISGGNDTTDKLYILEYDETMKYFETDESRKALAPANPEQSMYWLRTPGESQTMVMKVNQDGSFAHGERGDFVWYKSGIRPVMWIKIG
ncbi:MAG: hypothetical protein J6Y58_06305 [Clostridiales bacterium]|nr:hypothetical protein [Clostridiales bacterium]